MKNIISIGEALIDVYSQTNETKIEVGGASFNVACAIAALNNNKSYFMGTLSNDQYSNKIKEFINKYKIHTAMIQNSLSPTTIAKVTLDENKERNFQFIRNSDANFKLNLINKKVLEKIDFIHFGSATAFLPGKLKKSYTQLLKFALIKNIPFSFDPNFRDKLWPTEKKVKKFIKYCQPYLKKANLIKLSEAELSLVTKKANQEAAVQKLMKKNPKALICITRGNLDTLFTWQNTINYVPVTLCENLVDTTGAGDAFISKLIDLYVKQNINQMTKIDIIEEIIKKANLFAKYSVQYLGALTFLDHL